MKRLLSAIMFLLSAAGIFAQTDSEPLRIAVCGVAHGHLGDVVGRMDRGDFKVVGVWESNDKYRNDNWLVGRLPAEMFYSDLGEMLDAVKPEAVVAYGSILDHMKVVEECAPRGVHVMVEKPLATTYKQALRMKQLAEKYGIKIMTNFETTWYASNHYARQMAQSGRLGAVRRINVYDGHEGPKEIGCSDMFLGWLTDPVKNGGGAVMDFGCYGANLATWFMNGQKPLSVYAVLQHNKPDIYPAVDDDATIILEYPGTTVQIMASWCWPYSRKDMYVYGDRGYIYQKNGRQVQTFIDGRKGDEFDAPSLQKPYDDSYRYLKALVRGEIVEQPEDLSAIDNNITVVQILEAAVKSAKTGKAVKL
jgi:predicted dehydrogenase